MAEATTVARPYAEAAFALAREKNVLEPWSQRLRLIASIVQDPRVAEALDNPRLDAPEKQSLLLSIAGERLDEDARSFVRVLVEAGRVHLAPEIAEVFDGLKDRYEGAAKAEIETAFPLTDAQLADMKSALEKRFGKRIEATVRVNKDLIGGARVSVGDAVIDASVRAKLDSMHTQLRV